MFPCANLWSWLALVLALLTISSNADQREWKDLRGRKLKASLLRVETDHVLVEKDRTLLKLPLSKLSAGDQAFAKNSKREAETTRNERLDTLTGSKHEFPLRLKAFASPDGYKQSALLENYLKFTTKQYRQDFDRELRPSGQDEFAVLHVPQDYDETNLFGLYIEIPSTDEAYLPSEEYQEVFREKRLIYLSPHDAGNRVVLSKRLRLALDGVATVEGTYRIDPDRIYIGGLSGGGVSSTKIAFLLPKPFTAAVNIGRGALLESYTVQRTVSYGNGAGTIKKGSTYPPFIPGLDGKHPKLSRNYQEKRWAFVSGENDYNYEFAKASGSQWKKYGYRARYFHVPELGHEHPPAKTFAEVIEWIESGKR